jgi:hypothetical protein
MEYMVQAPMGQKGRQTGQNVSYVVALALATDGGVAKGKDGED